MSSFVERYEKLEKASELWLKGYSFAEIGRHLDISPIEAKSIIKDYQELTAQRAVEDPDFLDRLHENTLRAFDEISMVSKEAWQTYEYAKQMEMVNQQVNALKLTKELAETKAKLLNLLGVKADAGNMAKMRQLERVNEIVSGVIKEIVAVCPHCRVEAQVRLAEAFALMGRGEEAAEMQELEEEIPVITVEEDDHDHEGMMGDILGYD